MILNCNIYVRFLKLKFKNAKLDKLTPGYHQAHGREGKTQELFQGSSAYRVLAKKDQQFRLVEAKIRR